MGKVCDFGLAQAVGQAVAHAESIGTPGFMAPEMRTRAQTLTFSELCKCDIYSYGVLLVCLCCNNALYTELTAKNLNKKLRSGPWIKPQIPKECPTDLKILMSRCLREDPARRPTFTYVCD